MMKQLSRWLTPRQDIVVVDSLLAQINDTAPLAERIKWLENLFLWLRRDRGRGQSVNTHLRFVFNVLDRNRELKTKVARTLRSILREMNALDLFVSTGIAGDGKFVTELLQRAIGHLIPAPPRYHDVGEIFHLLFPSEDSAHWIEEINSQSAIGIVALLHHEEDQDKSGWNSIYADMREAAFYLTREIQVQSFAPEIRRRIGVTHIVDLAFYHLDKVVAMRLMDGKAESNLPEIQDQERRRPVSAEEIGLQWAAILKGCRLHLADAYQHLDQHGVSVNLVYRLDRIQAQLDRLETLVAILTDEQGRAIENLKRLFYELALLEQSSKSVRSLWRETLALLSKKIVEQNAETGSHYISYNREQYKSLVVAAIGGGLVTCLTVLGKVKLEDVEVSYFAKGFLYSLNYMISFLIIHQLGLTLATKQPAMTATTLAQKVRQLLQTRDYTALITEVRHLLRSQVVAILGNVLSVVPGMILIDAVLFYLNGHHLIDAKYARKILESHSLFGVTPLLAAFTGVLLWFSSIAAGWIGNWFVYRELNVAIAQHRGLRRFLGRIRTERIAKYLEVEVAGVSGNVVLGFLLGMTPKVFAFFGILLDVRHVTLSTGTVALAAYVMGAELSWKLGLLAVGGLIAAGIMNLSFSFGLAMMVANRSQRLSPRQVRVLYRHVMVALLKNPKALLFPQKS